jgi:hypothetical protein
MCIVHQAHAKKPLARKQASPMKKQSENFAMRQMQKQLAIKTEIFLRTHKTCEMHTPVCSVAATTIRTSVINGKEDLLNTSLWQASCEDCEHYISLHPDFITGGTMH